MVVHDKKDQYEVAPDIFTTKVKVVIYGEHSQFVEITNNIILS